MEFLPNQNYKPVTPKPADVAVANAKASVAQFLTYIRETPLGKEIRGSERLPVGKSALIDAFRLLIAHELRTEQSGQLQKVGLYLAQFRQREDSSAKETAEDWEQMFAEQEKLEKLFRLSARYSRRDLGMRQVHGKASLRNANRLDG